MPRSTSARRSRCGVSASTLPLLKARAIALLIDDVDVGEVNAEEERNGFAGAAAVVVLFGQEIVARGVRLTRDALGLAEELLLALGCADRSTGGLTQ